jgi:hypothetical protein
MSIQHRSLARGNTAAGNPFKLNEMNAAGPDFVFKKEISWKK